MLKPALQRYVPPSPDRLALRVAEAAKALGVDRRTLNEELLRGAIPSRRVKGVRVVGIAALEKWLAEGDGPGGEAGT